MLETESRERLQEELAGIDALELGRSHGHEPRPPALDRRRGRSSPRS